MFLCPLMIQLNDTGISIPEISRIKSPKLMLLSEFLFLVVIFILPINKITITKITNLSQSSGVFPSHFKHAHIIPLLKKSSLSANDLNSNRPISNISFHI